MNLHYVVAAEAQALAMIAAIDAIGGAPLASRSAASGELDAGAPTTTWASPRQRADGMWVFPKVPTELILAAGEAAENQFNAAFSYVFEEYQSDWFPEETE